MTEIVFANVAQVNGRFLSFFHFFVTGSMRYFISLAQKIRKHKGYFEEIPTVVNIKKQGQNMSRK